MRPRDNGQLDRAELLELYKLAVDEYRFNVRLGWERAKFFVGLHVALAGAAVALMRLEGQHPVPLAVLSLAGMAAAWVGLCAICRGHRYYRWTVYKKTLLEDQLGLAELVPGHQHRAATLAIGTTGTQQTTSPILKDTDNWVKRRIKLFSVVGSIRLFLWLIFIAHAASFAYQAFALLCAHCGR